MMTHQNKQQHTVSCRYYFVVHQAVKLSQGTYSTFTRACQSAQLTSVMISVAVRLLLYHSWRHKQEISQLIFQRTLFQLQMDKFSYSLTSSSQALDQQLTQDFQYHELVGTRKLKR